jgi:hypothetical protein
MMPATPGMSMFISLRSMNFRQIRNDTIFKTQVRSVNDRPPPSAAPFNTADQSSNITTTYDSRSMLKRELSSEPKPFGFGTVDYPPIKSPAKKVRKAAPTNRWTEEEWKVLCTLKEQGLSWPFNTCKYDLMIEILQKRFPNELLMGSDFIIKVQLRRKVKSLLLKR